MADKPVSKGADRKDRLSPRQKDAAAQPVPDLSRLADRKDRLRMTKP